MKKIRGLIIDVLNFDCILINVYQKTYLELVIMSKNNEQAIREAAYYIWQNAGCPQGQDEYFWSMAVEQISKNNKSSAKKTVSSNKSSSCKSSSCKKSSSAKKSSK